MGKKKQGKNALKAEKVYVQSHAAQYVTSGHFYLHLSDLGETPWDNVEEETRQSPHQESVCKSRESVSEMWGLVKGIL